MAAITWSDVVDIAPELADVSVGMQTLILSYVNDSVNVVVLDGESGSKTKLARVTLAAHIATILVRASSGKAGDITSESLGPQSRAYSSSSRFDETDLSLTGYGRTYRMIVRWSAARGPLVL